MRTDGELVALAVAGDRDAFGDLYRRHADAVHDLLRRMLRDHEAADALQDTFITAGERLHQLRDPARFRPWVYAIARRRAYLTTERRRRTTPLDDTEVASIDADPTDALAAGELRALIDGAAGGLDERDRLLLDLHLRHGLEGDDLADAVGVERSHLHVMMHRMRAKLESSIGAVALAQHGRPGCPELAAVTGPWTGELTPQVRKRITRHAKACPACSAERDRRLRPEAMLGLVPFTPAPAGASEVLGRIELCSYDGPPWAGPDGFPEPDGPWPAARRPRRRAALTVVGLFVAGGGVLAMAAMLGDSVPPAPASSTSVTVKAEDPEVPTLPSAPPAQPVELSATTTESESSTTTRRQGRPVTSTPSTAPETTTSTTAPETTTTSRPTRTTTSTTSTTSTTTTTWPEIPPIPPGRPGGPIGVN